LASAPLGSGPSAFKELPYFDRTVGFLLATAWFLTKSDLGPIENRPQLTDFLPQVQIDAHNLCTVILPKPQNCPFSSGRGDLNPRPLGPEDCGNLGIERNEGSFADLNYMESIELHKSPTICLQ
jgi:hypothetical protein